MAENITTAYSLGRGIADGLQAGAGAELGPVIDHEEEIYITKDGQESVTFSCKVNGRSFTIVVIDEDIMPFLGPEGNTQEEQ